MIKFTDVSIDKVERAHNYFTGYAWLVKDGQKVVHASIECDYSIKSVAGESRVFLKSVIMDGAGKFNLLSTDVLEIETELEKELQLY